MFRHVGKRSRLVKVRATRRGTAQIEGTGGDGKAEDANRLEASRKIEEQKGKSGEGLSVQVRKVMGWAFNLEEEWGQEEMSVGELGRRMIAEEWSMNEEAQ